MRMNDRLNGFLWGTAMGAGAAVIVGLSMGGSVTGTFVGRHPERVRSLTLVDPVAGMNRTAPLMFRLPVVGPVLWQALAVPVCPSPAGT